MNFQIIQEEFAVANLLKDRMVCEMIIIFQLISAKYLLCAEHYAKHFTGIIYSSRGKVISPVLQIRK